MNETTASAGAGAGGTVNETTATAAAGGGGVSGGGAAGAQVGTLATTGGGHPSITSTQAETPLPAQGTLGVALLALLGWIVLKRKELLSRFIR